MIPELYGASLVMLTFGGLGLFIGFVLKRRGRNVAESWIAGSAMAFLVGVAMMTTSGALG